jgi:hypothetical protein
MNRFAHLVLGILVGAVLNDWCGRHRDAFQSTWTEQASARPEGEITICDLRDGQGGYTVDWAFSGRYQVFAFPGGTVDTAIRREGNWIVFKGQSLNRVDWGCKDEGERYGAERDR